MVFLVSVGVPLSIMAFNISTANAGVLTFLAGILGDKEANASVNEGKYNSQTVALLQAPLANTFGTGGRDIEIDNNEALVPVDEIDDAQNDQISIYLVREGDTLSQVAKMFNVSINTIIWANNITRGSIAPGQSLVILPVSGIRHIIGKGETIQSIVKKHGGDLDEVLRFNDLSADSELAIGDEIIIPDGENGAVSGGKTTSVTVAKNKIIGGGYYMSPLRTYHKSQGIHGHNAVDLGAPIGTPIYATAAGRIIVSKNGGYNGGYGNYVVIAHPNGTQTLFAHMTKTAVAPGVSVVQGQLIGYVGSTGKSTGPHLHIEARGYANQY